MSNDPILDRWQAVADFQIKLIDAIGNYQVKTAQALNLEIEAETRAVERDIKLAVLKQLQLTYKRLQQTRFAVEKRSAVIRRRAADASLYFRGELINPAVIATAWIGFKYFYTMISQTARLEIDVITIDDTARAASNFFHNETLGPCEDAPADKKTAIGLINWLIKKNYIPVRGSAASTQIDQAFGVIATCGEAAIEQLQMCLVQLETETFTTFDPLKLASLPSNPALGADGAKAGVGPRSDARSE